MFLFPGYLLSATRSRRLDCQTINAGVVTLGESLRLVAAGGLIDPKLYTRYELTYDADVTTFFRPRPRRQFQVLVQECIRYNKLIDVMERSLPELQKALKGLVVMSGELEAVGKAIALNAVPEDWEAKVGDVAATMFAVCVASLHIKPMFLSVDTQLPQSPCRSSILC